MAAFIAENAGTIIVGALLAVILVIAAAKLVKDKKSGKNSCGCDCGCCPNAGLCGHGGAARQDPSDK